MPATKKPKASASKRKTSMGMFLCVVTRAPKDGSRFAGLRCHRAHRFSRREQRRRYRNLIKVAAILVAANAGTHSQVFCVRRQPSRLIERATRYGSQGRR